MPDKEKHLSFSSLKEVIIALIIMGIVLSVINIAVLNDYRLIYSLLPITMLVSFSIYGVNLKIIVLWIAGIVILAGIYGDLRYIGMIYPVIILASIKLLNIFAGRKNGLGV